MAGGSRQVNVTLDAEHAAKLALLAEREHTHVGNLARALLSQAIDDAGRDPRATVALLDGIAGAYERAQLGLEQAHSGQTSALDAP